MIEITTNVSVLLVILTIMEKNVLIVNLHTSGITTVSHAKLALKHIFMMEDIAFVLHTLPTFKMEDVLLVYLLATGIQQPTDV